MKTSRLILSLALAALAAACSQPDTSSSAAAASPASPASAASAASATASGQALNYSKLCENLVALAPAERKVNLRMTCTSDYEKMLPACTNADAVNSCYANMKSWDDRLACLDSCQKPGAPAKP